MTTGYFNLDVNWSIITDTEGWFTLKLNTCLVMAGASQEGGIYHIYVPTGELLTLADIFREF